MRNSKYEKYKTTEISWLKEIPNHWQEVDTKRCFLFPKTIVGEDFPDYKVLSLSVNGVIFRDMESRMGKHHSDMGTYQIIKPNSIVLCLFDMDVTPRIVGHSDKTGIITSAYTNISPKNNVDSKYYYYYYLLQDYNNYLFSQGTGIRTTLTRSQFGSLKIVLPPKQEQTTIANFLDYKTEKIYRFITKKKQLIELLNEQKAAIINQAVTKGITPNVPMKDSGIEWLGKIPEHWEVRKLKYVANCFPSNVDKHSKENEKEVRLCNYTDVYKNDFITNDMKLMIATAKDDQIEKFALKKDDVIITKDSETADDIANPAMVIEDLENVICGYHLTVMRPYKNLLGSYLLRSLQCKFLNIQFEICSNGVTRVGLGVYDTINAEILVPPIEEQINISEYIQSELITVTKTISSIEKEITLVEEYKTALIAEAVTGKIDVRDFKLPTEETPLAMVAEEAANYNKR